MEISYKLENFNKKAIMKSYGLNNSKNGYLQLKSGLKQKVDYKIGNDANLFLANTCFRRMSKYVPKDTGALMTTVTVRPNSVTYEVPYAHRQYVTNKGKGIRGKYWDKKMKNAEGHLVAKEVEAYVKNLKGNS